MSRKTASLPELAGTKEAAAVFGVRTQNFLRDWAKRPDFPAPVATLAATPVWRRDELEDYRVRMNRSAPSSGGQADHRAAVDLQAITDRLVEALQPSRIVLFGSRARGDARPDSDIDLLIVMPELSSRHRTTAGALRAIGPLDHDVDVVAVSEAEARARGSLPGTAIYDALTRGKVLYGPD